MDKFSANQKRVVYITVFLIALINLVAILHIAGRSEAANPNVNGINIINQNAIRLNPIEDTESQVIEPNIEEIDGVRPISYAPISVRAD
jgi:hypothetical protein